MSEVKSAITEQIQRLRVLWPALNSRPETTDEIVRAVMRYSQRLVPSDIHTGFDRVIEASPTSGWPPGPHEVVGCVLQARRERNNASESPRRHAGGISFSEWWHSLPGEERAQHEALRKMMEKRDPVAPPQVKVAPKPDDIALLAEFRSPSGTPSDTIDWEAA